MSNLRCSNCKKMLKIGSCKGLCGSCYRDEWKRINYKAKKPKGYCNYKEVHVVS